METNTGQHDKSGTHIAFLDVIGPSCQRHGPDHIEILADPNDGDNAWWVCSLDGASTRIEPWH